MRRSGLIGLLVTASLAAAAVAQVGHPAKGSWSGYWGTSDASKRRILLLLDWRDRQITGVINPGPKAIPIADATLTPEGWRVTMSARTAAGEPIAFTGAIANIGAYDRAIEGTWTEGGREYRIRMVRE